MQPDYKEQHGGVTVGKNKAMRSMQVGSVGLCLKSFTLQRYPARMRRAPSAPGGGAGTASMLQRTNRIGKGAAGHKSPCRVYSLAASKSSFTLVSKDGYLQTASLQPSRPGRYVPSELHFRRGVGQWGVCEGEHGLRITPVLLFSFSSLSRLRGDSQSIAAS